MRIWISIIALIFVGLSFGQELSQYRKEPIKYFEFEPFQRSFTGVDESMDSLTEKPVEDWKYQDSLQFIINIAKLGNHSRAYNELKRFRLHDINNETAAHLTMIYSLVGRYDLAKRWLKQYKPESRQQTLAKELWLDILILREDLKEMRKTLKYEDVFVVEDKLQYSDEEKEGERFIRDVIEPLEAGEIILRFHILYTNERDPVLAKLAVQMGEVIHQHLSLTMTYVAFSLAKHYDKSADNGKRVANVKQEILDKNYEIITLKNFFPKAKKSRFSYEALKRKQEEEEKKRYSPKPFETEEKESIWVSKGFIITTGLLIILLLILFLVRTKKK